MGAVELHNGSDRSWEGLAFSGVLVASTERLEPKGRWGRHLWLECAFGSGVVTVAPGTVHPAGGIQGATTPRSHLRPGRYRVVVWIEPEWHGGTGFSVHERRIVAYELDVR